MPLSAIAPEWEGVTLRTLCINVKQFYPKVEEYPEIEEEFSLPFSKTVENFLAVIGVEAVVEGVVCDATLDITTRGYALGERCSIGTSLDFCYSGAEIKGEVRLSAPERAPLSWPIERSYPPPDAVVGCSRDPRSAPFTAAWTEAFLEVSARIWGPHVLIRAVARDDYEEISSSAASLLEAGKREFISSFVQALQDGDWKTRRAAANFLDGMWAYEAIPALIQVLEEDENEIVRFHAQMALESITGHDFGEDSTLWREWWEGLRQQ